MERSIVVRSLSPELLGDFLSFFDGPAFRDNPEWGSCYCRCFKTAGSKAWDALTGAQNRLDAEREIGNGYMKGYLAYVDGAVRGWCAADAKSAYPMLAEFPGIPDGEEVDTACIVCLLVEARYRGKGIGRALVEAAAAGIAGRGFRWLEAYPRKVPQGTVMGDDEAYPGPLGMYESLGFNVVREAGERIVVRK